MLTKLITRREALHVLGATGGLLALGGAGLATREFLNRPRFNHIPAKLHGANLKVGHLLREAIKAVPQETRDIGTLIVGGGIAGLSAAWFLQKNGVTDFEVLELDREVGGNSASGKNEVSAYPWAAHYVPLPSPEAKEVRALFEELGIITGYRDGLPVYNEYYLCADPHERLFDRGIWSESLVPNVGLTPEERAKLREFFAFTDSLKNKRGRDGRVIFNIPLEHSSVDPDWRGLDRVSFQDFLKERGWDVAPLQWYVDYCCRDDYGFRAEFVSAWAGLHYFASRSGEAANADAQTVLTWPEGNGWIAQRLRDKLEKHLRVNRLAYRIQNEGDFVIVDVIKADSGEVTRYRAKDVIYAGPRFTANHIVKDLPRLPSPEHAPWVVANVTVERVPVTEGAPLSWDNVSTYSPSLGYIVANHQDLTILRTAKVLTYYRPLDERDAKTEREEAQKRTLEEWREMVLADLERMHPGLHREVRTIDIWVWGHGMPSPGIDYVWNTEREKRFAPFGRVHFAHADQSGISVFEEAQFRGVEAARRVLKKRPPDRPA